MVVTRLEIAETIDSVFGDGPVSRDQIITAAQNAGARPDVVAALERLPERSFPHLRELWQHLPGPTGQRLQRLTAGTPHARPSRYVTFKEAVPIASSVGPGFTSDDEGGAALPQGGDVGASTLTRPPVTS
ncbi:DUF2795 domain-containing protein [Actinomadura sp. 6K520]|uniref:DUF2795 domain-containing protein n=1 Tax=Actinomadura sp. 6K520 TaxID=2530364 RepID=UPI001FB60B36|nr:DUF2795 domain-containing protein [Actinomadura sp. 6K520]